VAGLDLFKKAKVPKARPIRATCPPILPSPTIPKLFPQRSWPTDLWQPPFRIALPGEFHLRYVLREDIPKLFTRTAELAAGRQLE
jgi:hypothetical protein